MKRVLMMGCTAVVFFLAMCVFAQEKTVDQLTEESVAKCKETASTKPTAKIIVEKVSKACEMIAKDGEAAFPMFKGKDSEFIFAGTYIWVQSAKGAIMKMHPIKPKMEGTDTSGIRDQKGVAFNDEIEAIVKKDGAGWVTYAWPKPGEKEASTKTAYVRLAKHGDAEYIVGCGVYDLSLEQVKKELEEKK